MTEQATTTSGRRRLARGLAEAVPVRRAERSASEDLIEAFVTRTARALGQIARRMPRERLVEAVGAASDADVLYRTLQEPAAIGAELEVVPDPLTAALLRGAEMKRNLLKSEGGVLSAAQLAAFLGITAAGLNKRRERNRVFWLEVGDGYVYPAFQVGETGLAPGMAAVLGAFTIDDPWMRVQFMLTGDRRLGGKRPLDLLRAGRVEPVVRAAAAYGEHGAA